MFGRALVLGLTMLQAFLPSPAGQEAGSQEPPGTSKGAGEQGTLEITYVGNEGVLIAHGGTKVLVDALYRSGVAGYPVHAAGLRSRLESAAAPFDGVDVVLATHFHADHFDAEAVAAHMAASPEALFISTPQAVERLRGLSSWSSIASRVKTAFPHGDEKLRLEHAGVTVIAINLHHGRERPVENLGFVIAIGGRKLLHIGDTEATVDEMAGFHRMRPRR